MAALGTAAFYEGDDSCQLSIEGFGLSTHLGLFQRLVNLLLVNLDILDLLSLLLWLLLLLDRGRFTLDEIIRTLCVRSHGSTRDCDVFSLFERLRDVLFGNILELCTAFTAAR